jgi:type I restriction enzyme M protein
VLTNPPFGGKEGKTAQTGFDYKTGATQTLFVQLVLRSLTPSGRCGIVVDDGFLSRTSEEAFVKTKRKLLDECELFAVVTLPPGVFIAAGAGVKTDLLFFLRGKPTERIWYYDLSDRKVGKKTPLTLDDFSDFFQRLKDRSDSDRSWTLDFSGRRRRAAEDAKPFRETETHWKAQAESLRIAIADIKRSKTRDDAKLREAEANFETANRAIREAAARAQAIEDAVYDLKAVNPYKKLEVDERSPSELLSLADMKAKEVSDILAALRSLNA